MKNGKSSDEEGEVEDDITLANRIRKAVDFAELCALFGYVHEDHVVQTSDGYLLGLHRISHAKAEHPASAGGFAKKVRKPVVYLHHGLLMCSDVFLCATNAERALPLVLAEAGYDVWLGNNRGNKYSRKHRALSPHSTAFWNYGIDEFAWHDIPDSIEYILEVTGEKSLSYVGFSQGTAQAFAALSICPALNAKVNVFVALAPAMSPPGLASPVVDGLMKASPALMYLFFGRRVILSSATLWQSILYPPIFASIIDASLRFLFAWSGENIAPAQKIAAYAHLYSASSTKSVVHWFQIMRNRAFLMYDDDARALSPSPPPGTRAQGQTRFYYVPARFPTKNICAPVVLLYGTHDSLVDIKVMTDQLPGETVAIPLDGYEHVDILWGRHVDRDVIPEVLKALDKYARGADEICPKQITINGI